MTTTPTDIGSIGQNHYRFTDITHNDSWIVSDDPSVSVASIRFWNSVSGTLPNSDGRTYLMSLGITDPLIPVVHAAPTLQSVVDLSGSGTTSSARASVTGGVGSIVVFLVGLVAFVVFGVIIFEIIRRRRRA